MTRFSCFIISVWLFGCGGCSRGIEEVHRPSDVKLRIALHTDTPVIAPGTAPRFVARLLNDAAEPITVVLPGDGSLDGRRTPIVRWNPLMKRGGSCGNINGLKTNEVVTIGPGESVQLDWIYEPNLTAPGLHSVSLELENVPDLRWGGIPLKEHDAATMERVRRTVPFKIVSNVVEVEVRK